MEGVEEDFVSFQSLGDRPSLHCCFDYTNGNDNLQVDAPKKEAPLITLQHGEANTGWLNLAYVLGHSFRTSTIQSYKLA